MTLPDLLPPHRPTQQRPTSSPTTMLTRQQIGDCLQALGFTRSPLDRSFHYAGIHIVVLDAPRIAARTADGLVYLAVLSLLQLEDQLTKLLGYHRPMASSR